MALRSRNLPALAALYGVAAHLYFFARFGGRWVDSDTARLIQISDRMWEAGAPVSSLASFYTSGTGFPLFEGFMARALGVSTVHYGLLVHPMVGVISILAAWVLARRLTSDPRVQAAAIFLVAASPDILFETSRGSHGGLAQAAFLICVLGAVQLLAWRDHQGAWVSIVAVGLIAIGILNLKRAILVGTILLFLAICVMVVAFVRRERRSWRPSPYLAAPLVGITLAVLLANWSSDGGIISQLSRQLSGLLGAGAPTATDAYVPPGGRAAAATSLIGYMYAAWGSPARYLWFALWNIVVPLLAFVAWVAMIPRLVDRRHAPTHATVVLWALGAGVGIWLVAVTFGASVLGVLDHIYPLRIFAYAAMAFALLAAGAIVSWTAAKPKLRLPAVLVLAVWLAVAGPMKATSEPLVNNHWRFFSEAEWLALGAVGRLEESPWVWVGPDDPGWENRLANTFLLAAPGRPLYAMNSSQEPRSFFLSPIVEAHAARMHVEIPDLGLYHRVYDNGGASYWARLAY